jgi:hypothetical protein
MIFSSPSQFGQCLVELKHAADRGPARIIN